MANVTAILDEAASLGPNMGCIEDAIDKYRGYGLRLQLYYQSPAQLKKCFPADQDQTVLANMSQIYFGVNDSSAEHISNRLGDETIIVRSGGTGTGYSSPTNWGANGHATSSSNSSSNWNQMGRRLLKPEEILSLNERVAITLVPGMRPICTTLQRYYERKAKPPHLSGSACVIFAVNLLVYATYLLLTCLQLMEKSHERPFQRNQEFRARNIRRAEASGYPRVNGVGQRIIQR